MAESPPEVLRVEQGKGAALAFGMGLLGLLLGIALGITKGTTFWGIVGGAAVVGYLVGRTIKRRRCSGCDERLTHDDETCPGCGGIIKGNVKGKVRGARIPR
jgi:hypothetical protein